jgi:HAMP domain-containing protein
VLDPDSPTLVVASVVDEASLRRARRRGRRAQVLGAALLAYGVIGIVIFVVVAVALNRPLERVGELSQSVEEQRMALIDTMQQTEETIRQMASGVGRMDASLEDAQAAVDRSSAIAAGVSASMLQLRDAMGVTIPILNTQPLLGLAPGFDNASQQLQLLSQDLATIATSLDQNREDVVASAESLVELADSVAVLTESVENGPGVGIAEEALDAFRIGLFAVAGWLVLFAVGCAVAGVYLLINGRREARGATMLE